MKTLLSAGCAGAFLTALVPAFVLAGVFLAAAVLLFLVAAVFLDAILYSNPERICFAGNGSSPFALFPARVFCGAPAQNALRMTPATEEPSADLLLNNI
jgi:hypothetical protein